MVCAEWKYLHVFKKNKKQETRYIWRLQETRYIWRFLIDVNYTQQTLKCFLELFEIQIRCQRLGINAT